MSVQCKRSMKIDCKDLQISLNCIFWLDNTLFQWALTLLTLFSHIYNILVTCFKELLRHGPSVCVGRSLVDSGGADAEILFLLTSSVITQIIG